MGLCSAIRPNNEPLRGSARVVPDSVTSVAWGRQEDDQEDQAGCDETCDDKMTFEKMQT